MVSFTIAVENDGGEVLTGVAITDETLLRGDGTALALTSGPDFVSNSGSSPQGTLEIGETATYEASYTLTQADVDVGSITNRATASGGAVSETSDLVTVPLPAHPGMTVRREARLVDANGNGVADAGETMEYTYIVENTGNVTLTDVVIDDPSIPVSGGPVDLAPGETDAVTFTAAYTLTQDDLDAGRVDDGATGEATAPDGTPVTADSDGGGAALAGEPGLAMVKTGTFMDADGDGEADVGETVAYTFAITNTGNVTLTDIVLDDPGATIFGGPLLSLAPGVTDETTFTGVRTLTQDDLDAGRVVNIASLSGTAPDGSEISITTEEDGGGTVLPGEPALALVKTGTFMDEDGDGVADAGETIEYTFTVENIGSATLTDIVVSDAMVEVTGGPLASLAPGESDSTTFAAVYTLTQADADAGGVVNVASVTGTAPDGTEISAESGGEATELAGAPGLALVKTGAFQDENGSGTTDAGETILYSFRVTNTGTVTLSDVVPVDEGPVFAGQPGRGSLSAFSPQTATLAPGEEQVFTAAYTLAQEDVEAAAGRAEAVTNAAHASGRAPSGGNWPSEITSDESAAPPVSLPEAAPPAVEVVKTALLRHVRRGGEAPFLIEIANPSGGGGSVTVIDTMPVGFRYVAGSATVDGAAVTPLVEGRRIVFEDVPLGPEGKAGIRLRLTVLGTAGPGEHVNRAHAEDAAGNRLSREARAAVEVLAEPVFDCGDIVGRVFDDVNRNGYQDAGEPGLAGVRVASVRGWLITTDAHGRFHVACADLPDARIGSNFLLKLDTRTLPTGYRLTTENPRAVRLTAGKLTELAFGAAAGRVVRVELTDAAFAPGRAELQPAWMRLDELIGLLAEERSVLELRYAAAGADRQLAGQRMRHVKALIASRWQQARGHYPLDIETRIEAAP